jgi:hypothetical protein
MGLFAILFASYMIFSPAEYNVVDSHLDKAIKIEKLDSGLTSFDVAGIAAFNLDVQPLDYSKMND